ncbi:unnamed protein product [Rotaria sp. Silwood2]|nr:unnamed protein product [Rotaria sp. Silwood2]CAF3943054.1 unnamed protein product [Rotaria sp. Silwood2]
MTSSSATLLKERDAFRKRRADAANFLASNEKRQNIDKTSSQKLSRSKTSSSFRTLNNSSSMSSGEDFSILRIIVEGLHERFLSGQIDPLTLDEIIKDFGLTINSSVRHWLASQVLLSNEKIDVKTTDNIHRFVYKPSLDLKGPKKSSLLKLLKSRYENGENAVTVEDVRDSIQQPKADKLIRSLVESGDVVKVESSKREVLFYNDRHFNIDIHQEFINAWRTISVEHLTNEQIHNFIREKGYYSLTTNAPKLAQLPKKPLKRVVRRPVTLKHNQHVIDQLNDYSNATNTK